MSIKYDPAWQNNNDLAYSEVIKDFIARMLQSVRTQVLNVVTSMTTPLFTLVNTAEGSTAGFVIQTARELHTLALANTSDTTTISVPVGGMLLGAQMNVDVAITTSAATDTWQAAFITGSTTVIAAPATAPAVNTKINIMFPAEITAAGIAEVQFTAPGVETFATGQVEVLVYYATLTPMANF